MSAAELLQNFVKGEFQPVSILKGSEPYLDSELRKALIENGYVIEKREGTKVLGSSEIEDICRGGGGLFGSQTCVWLQVEEALSKWPEEILSQWKRLSSLADGRSLLWILQVPSDKRLKWEGLGQGLVPIEWAIPTKDRMFWIRRMCAAEAQPQFVLDERRLHFLSNMEAELSTLNQWVELWSLGGDLWASVALGWQASVKSEATSAIAQSKFPLFDWVDAVMERDRKKALRLLSYLLQHGFAPLQLSGVLSKSVRGWYLFSQGENRQVAPFIGDKWRRILSRNAKNWPGDLLARCADLDRSLKSSRAKPEVLLQTLLDA